LPQRAAAAGRVVLYLTTSLYRSERLAEVEVPRAGLWAGVRGNALEWTARRVRLVDALVVRPSG
jgi:hypothetical protein